MPEVPKAGPLARGPPSSRPGIIDRLRELTTEEKKRPFLDDRPREEQQSAQPWEDFKRPRLKRCGLPPEIEWLEQMGHGTDGIVWKVNIAGTVYALKVFWDKEPSPDDVPYWAIQRECWNAALIQNIRAAIEASPEPIYLNPRPQTRQDAIRNLRAFSEEGRRGTAFKDLPDAVQCTSAAGLRRCFGWTQVSGKKLHSLWDLIPARSRPPFHVMGKVGRSEEYYGIVYEFIEEAEPGDHYDVMQPQIDLLWLAGFSLVTLRRENWVGGILLDMADIVYPRSPMWFEKAYERIVMQ